MRSRANLAAAVIFDADDTLWSTEPLYDAARARAREAVSGAGLDGAAWDALQRGLDLSSFRSLGYSPERFPSSCAQAYEELCRDAQRLVDPAVLAAVRNAALGVFTAEAPLLTSARATLSRLVEDGWRLALLTKGDVVVQKRRLEQSGLRPFFERALIVAEKTPEVIAELAFCLGTKKSRTWMVGNSLRSDVLPALAAGLNAIWIDAHVWEHERSGPAERDPRAVVLSRLADVPAYVAAATRASKRLAG